MTWRDHGDDGYDGDDEGDVVAVDDDSYDVVDGDGDDEGDGDDDEGDVDVVTVVAVDNYDVEDKGDVDVVTPRHV